MKPSKLLRSFLLTAGSSLLVVSLASAQTITWDAGGGAATTAWYTNTNWNPDTASGAWTTANVAQFADAGTATTAGINMGTAALSIGAIEVTNARTRVLTIGNSSGTTGTLTLNSATVNSIANTVLRNASAHLLTLQNNETGSGKTMNVALAGSSNVIQINGNGGITISSNISGSGGISKQGTGSGVLTLSGNNSYTGVTAISAGVVTISSANALGATGTGNTTTVDANGSATGGRLQVAGISSAEAITLTGTTEVTGFGGAIVSTNGTSTLSGNITLAGSGGLKILANSGTTLNLTGNISQTTTTHGLVLQSFGGSGVLNVSNPLAINGGTLLVVGSNGTAGGLVTLSGASGAGIGATTIGQRATLRLGVTNALNTSANLDISYGGSTAGEDMATFDLRGFNQTINALNGTVGSSNSSANSNRLVTNGAASGTSILTVGNGNGSGTFNGQINNGATASIQLIKTGTGNQTLNDQNSYTGGTRIDSGTLTLGHATNTLADTGAVNVNGGTLALGTRIDSVGAVTLTSGSITGSGTGALTGTSYGVQSGSVSAILAGANVALTKSTAGNVTLSGANTYTGLTTISGGTLINGSATTFTNKGQLTLDGGTFDLGGFAASVTFANGTANGGSFTNTGSAASLTLNTTNTGLLVASGGTITVGSGVTITKVNTFYLGADNAAGNTPAGNITINSGGKITNTTGSASLVINGLGTNVTVNAGGSLDHAASGGQFAVGQLAGSNNTLTVNGGTVLAPRGLLLGNLGTGTITMTSGSVTAGGTASNLIFGNGASSTGNVFNLNGGILTTSGITNPNGTAAFNFGGGTIKASTGFTWASSANMTATVNGGGLTVDTNNFDITIAQALIDGTGANRGLTKTGTGTLTLSSANNTYSGATNVNAGTLLINGSTSTGEVNVASGATLGGTGTVGGALTVNSGGIFAPGDSGIESLNVTGTLTLAAGSISNFQINTAGNDADLAIAAALLTFGGTLNVNNAGAALENGDIFNLFDWVSTNASGTFSTVTLPALTGTLTWDQSKLYTHGTLTVIPEPSAALLGVLGGMLLLRRRRNVR